MSKSQVWDSVRPAVGGADLLWEKNTAGYLPGADLVCEKSTTDWLADKPVEQGK